MVDLATGLGAIGGLASGFRKSSPSKDTFRALQGAFTAADKFGLHRLSVAGSPAGYSPVASNAGEGLMRAGDALRQGQEQKSNRGITKKQGQLIDAQIEEARSRTILNQANARRAVSGPQPGLGGATTETQRAFDRLSNNGERSISREPERDMPATQTVTLGKTTARGPNAEAFEVGLSELLAGALVYGPQWLAKKFDPTRMNERSKDRKKRRPKMAPRPIQHY